MNIFFIEMKKAIISPFIVLGVIVCILGFLFSGVIDILLLAGGDAFSKFGYAIEDNNARWFLIIGATIPYATNFCIEVKSKYYYFETSRTNYKKLSACKYVACAMSGGTVVVLSCMLAFAICCVNSDTIASLSDGSRASLTGSIPFVNLISNGNLAAYFACYLCAQFLFGAFWSAMGLLLSTFVCEIYIPLAAPLIVSMLITQLFALFNLPSLFNPVIASTVSKIVDPLLALGSIVFVYLIYLVGMYCLYRCRARRVLYA